MGIERAIDFGRFRRMRCGRCGHETLADHEWMERWEQGSKCCPECGIDCTVEDRARPFHEPNDPVLQDDTVLTLNWYHTSTIPDWPQINYDPRSQIAIEGLRRLERMMGSGGVERWVERQKSKALHVGTYEAAIENMLRRMRDQYEPDSPFYLFRVELRHDAGIEPGVHREPTNWVGDAQPKDFLSPGNLIYRYINEHEDPGGISLALTTQAIASVTGVKLPIVVGNVSHSHQRTSRDDEALDSLLADSEVPDRLRDRFEWAIDKAVIDGGADVDDAFVQGLIDLVINPAKVLRELNSLKPRSISTLPHRGQYPV